MDSDVKYDFFYRQTEHHLVQKYFSMRARAFIEKWGLKNFSGEEDRFDEDAHILILHKHGQCLGGGRLILHDLEKCPVLPMETDGFRLVSLFPELELYKNKYSELSKVALSPELRNGEYSTEIYRQIGERGKLLGISYVFAVTTILQARMARIACRSVGLSLVNHPEIKVPTLATYEDNEMQLSTVDLNYNYVPQKVTEET